MDGVRLRQQEESFDDYETRRWEERRGDGMGWVDLGIALHCDGVPGRAVVERPGLAWHGMA